MKWLRCSARILGLAVIAWWLAFSLLSQGFTGEVIEAMAVGGVLLISVAIAWRWEAVGGALLVLESLAASGFVLLSASCFVHWPLELMFLPLLLWPLVTGVLFIASWFTSRQPTTPQGW